ncbi:MAG: general secretion pathway protein GspK [Deltaproteobacteria bacterium]|nr:general secretion pathway protein GspK [Deltaproteobacteria bacterium]
MVLSRARRPDGAIERGAPSLARAFRRALGAAGEVVRRSPAGDGAAPSPRQRGFAMLMVLVVVAVVSALSTQFTYNTRANIWMAGNLEASVKAYFNARSATKIALLAVNAKKNFPQMQKFLSLMGKGAAQRLEIWQRACDFVNIFATGRAEFFGTPLLDFSREKAVGADSGVEGRPGFTCKVTAEDARVNLNRAATEPVLPDPNNPNADVAALTAQQTQLQQRRAAQLYVQLGGLLAPMVKSGEFQTEDEVLDVILNVIDWTDADTTKSEIDQEGNFAVGGGGEPDYGKYGYESKNAKFDTVGEVQLVDGMSSDVFCQIRDELTVFATDKVNVNDASIMVLKGILCQSIQDEVARVQLCLMPGPTGLAPIDDALIALETCRELKKQVYSTPFTSMSRFTQFFEQFPQALGTGVPLPITASIVNQQLGVRTKMVRIEAEGFFGDTQRKMVSIVDTASGTLVHFHYE